MRPADDDAAPPDAPRPPSRPPGAGAPPGPGDEFDPEDLGPEEQAELAQRLDELRRQLLSTPAEVVVANHAYGLFELAAIHLSQRPPSLDEARLAVDAMAALVEGLAGRLGEPERSLQDALAQIRLAFVQINEAAVAEGPDSDAPAP